MRLNENNDLFPDKNQNQNENTRADVLDQSVHRIKHTGMFRHAVNIPTRVGVGNKYINEIRVVQWVYIYTGVTYFLLLLLPRKSEMGGVQYEGKVYG